MFPLSRWLLPIVYLGNWWSNIFLLTGASRHLYTYPNRIRFNHIFYSDNDLRFLSNWCIFKSKPVLSRIQFCKDGFLTSSIFHWNKNHSHLIRITSSDHKLVPVLQTVHLCSKFYIYGQLYVFDVINHSMIISRYILTNIEVFHKQIIPLYSCSTLFPLSLSLLVLFYLLLYTWPTDGPTLSCTSASTCLFH